MRRRTRNGDRGLVRVMRSRAAALTTVAELGYQRSAALTAYATDHAHLLAARSQAADLVTVNTARAAQLAARARDIQGQVEALSTALRRLPPSPPGGLYVMPMP